MLTPQPASIHIDVDKEGHSETSLNGRIIDLHFAAALINKKMIERGPMPIDEYFDFMKEFCVLTDKLEGENTQNMDLKKFHEMFKDLDI